MQRQEAIKVLKQKLRAKSLYEIALELSIKIDNNRGWVGETIHKLLEHDDNFAGRDAEDYELKTTRIKILKSGDYSPIWPMAITMCTPSDLQNNAFDVSRVLNKIQRMIFVQYEQVNAKDPRTAKVRFVLPVEPDSQLIQKLREDYNLYQANTDKYFASSKGTSQNMLQLRRKGGKDARKGRAFYATLRFLKFIGGM